MISQANRFFWKVCKSNFFFFIFLFFSQEFLLQLFAQFNRIAQVTADFSTNALIDFGFFAIDFLFSFIFLMSIPFLLAGEKGSLWQKARQNLNQICIEMLRGISSILRWSILFILPGLYRHLQYLFIPFIVFFSEGYARGEKDALEESKRLFNQAKWFLLAFSIIFTLLHSFIDQISAQKLYAESFLVPFWRLLYTAMSIYLYCFLFAAYKKLEASDVHRSL